MMKETSEIFTEKIPMESAYGQDVQDKIARKVNHLELSEFLVAHLHFCYAKVIVNQWTASGNVQGTAQQRDAVLPITGLDFRIMGK